MPSSIKGLKAFLGWIFTFFSGFCMGVGIIFIVVVQIIVKRFGVVDPSAYADAMALAPIFIFLGVISGALGVYSLYSSFKTVFPPQPPPLVTAPIEKKYCRYCGAENRHDAVFCEKCAKKLL